MQDTKLKKEYIKESKDFLDARLSQYKILVIIPAANYYYFNGGKIRNQKYL